MKHDILDKNEFNISDLAKIVKKQTQTIRSYERKGIINKPDKKASNGWRVYSKSDLANTLENILNYNWQRNVIKNESEIKQIIEYLRGNVDKSTFNILSENMNE
ncbi:MAG: MerR family transcriptional regulator [archaeon]